MSRASIVCLSAIVLLGTAGCVGTAQQLQPGQMPYGYNPYAYSAPAYGGGGQSASSGWFSGGGGGGGSRSSAPRNTGLPFGTSVGTGAILFGGI